MTRNKLKAIFFILFAVLGISAIEVSARDITGYWFANDGGAYFLTQVGEKVYGYAEHPDGSYANVLSGTRNGDIVALRWWDIPKGKAKGGGEVIFHIVGKNETQLSKQSSSAPFGTEFIQWGGTVGELSTKGFRSKPEAYRGEQNKLTGVWNGDDFATYYVREMSDGTVVFFAETNFWGDPGGSVQPEFAYVFIGKKEGSSVKGDWVCLPKGKRTGNGKIEFITKSEQLINFTSDSAVKHLRRSLPNNLEGFADLHTHPMVHLGFGRKFIHGAPDAGSIIPADHNCKMNYRATSIEEALDRDNSTHGGTGWFGFDNRCGDNIRQAVLDTFQEMLKGVVTPDNSVGYPSFKDYPKYNDLTHQKMWVDWIRRAYNGGQRVMVALATNNQTLASAVSGPGDGPVTDKESADLQIEEMKAFAKRHNDFMEVAYSSADVRRIVSQNKMAIILGIEIDNIGNFINSKQNAWGSAQGVYKDTVAQNVHDAEIDRLYKNGVRYVFPVHQIDNLYGGTAIYEDIFNLSNYHIRHKYWEITCSPKSEGITKRFVVNGFDGLLAAAKASKLGIDIASMPPTPRACDSADDSGGHMNENGLSKSNGEAIIKKLMSKGMLIDVDHASLKTVESILSKAEAVSGGYPVVSGHTGLRQFQKTENSRSKDQLQRIANLGGMFGLGSDDVLSTKWLEQYKIANEWMKGEGRISFGTDLNGLVKGPPPRPGANIYNSLFTRPRTGDKTWDYSKDGVVHYGMLADYLQDIKSQPNYGLTAYNNLMKNAEAFARMWEKAEKAAKNVK